MPPRGLESRAALTLALALVLAATHEARAQALDPLPLPTSAGPLSRTNAGASTYEEPPSPYEELRGGLPPAALKSSVSNYGEPRPKIRLPKPYPPLRVHSGAPRKFKNSLPALEAYKTSAVARRALRLRAMRLRAMRLRSAPEDPGNPKEPTEEIPPTVAIPATIKTKPKPKLEERPYDPIGVGIGSMRLSPFVETSTGYDTNPDRLTNSNDPQGSKFFRADAGFKLRTDWARDDLTADLRLGYVDYFNYQQASRPDGAGNLVGRYDVTRDTAIDVLGRFTLDTQRPGAPAISSGLPNVTVTNRPAIFAAGTTVGVTQRFSRLEVSLRGSFDRTFYQDAYYSDGSTLNLASTDFNDYGVIGGVAYEINPSLKPFVEATYDSRVHDAYTDPDGYARDSVGYAARGGAKIRISDLLTGEAAGGYAERDYQDPRLQKLRGPTIDGSLIYTPTALTTLNLRAATTLNETTLSAASGALTRTYGAELTHDLFRNLRLAALGTYYTNDYQGVSLVERGYIAGAKIEYKITGSLALKATYSHERLDSSAPNSNYTADVFMLGLRFQP